jgi:hypothetical protein
MKVSQLHRSLWLAFAILISFLLSVVFSCKKDKDKGFVEISDVSTDGKVKTVSVNLMPGNVTVNAITLKNKSSDKSVHVKLTLDSTGMGAITGLKYLLPSRFTLASLEYDVPANGAVNVPLTINPYYFTADTVYGIGFKIESVSSGDIAIDAGKIIVKFDFRNRWDGRYRVTGTLTDFANPAVTFTEQETSLITMGPTSVYMVPRDLGIPGYLIRNGVSLSYYGGFGPVFHFDPSNNKITAVVNYYIQPASNPRTGELDPSGSNQYDPAIKAITVKFWLNEPGLITTPPHHRVAFTNTLLYLGPRY